MFDVQHTISWSQSPTISPQLPPSDQRQVSVEIDEQRDV
jgi:hypothetical protein